MCESLKDACMIMIENSGATETAFGNRASGTPTCVTYAVACVNSMYCEREPYRRVRI